MPLNAVRAHRWDLTPAEARTLQTQLAGRIETTDRFGDIKLVAGIDVGFEADGRVTRAAVVVLTLADLLPVESAVAREDTTFPYVPGLLSFREIPAVLDALAELETEPDLLICDGHGFAHPRRFGLACHLGWLVDTPCIGVAKSRLIGRFDEPGQDRGAASALIDSEQTIGVVLRSRALVKPVFVSVGHRVGVNSAVALTMACTGRYRLPETTRHAHRLASQVEAKKGGSGSRPKRRR